MKRYRVVEEITNGFRAYSVEEKRWYGWRVCQYGDDYTAVFSSVKEAETFLYQRRCRDNPTVERQVLYEVKDE